MVYGENYYTDVYTQDWAEDCAKRVEAQTQEDTDRNDNIESGNSWGQK
jgi:hypothetical protein